MSVGLESQAREVKLVDVNYSSTMPDIIMSVPDSLVNNTRAGMLKLYGLNFYLSANDSQIVPFLSYANSPGCAGPCSNYYLVHIKNIETTISLRKSLFQSDIIGFNMEKGASNERYQKFEDGLGEQAEPSLTITQYDPQNLSREVYQHTYRLLSSKIGGVEEEVLFCQKNGFGSSCTLGIRLKCEPGMEIDVSMLPGNITASGADYQTGRVTALVVTWMSNALCKAMT